MLEELLCVDAKSKEVTLYGSIEEYLDRADEELRIGIIALPPVYKPFIEEEAKKAVARYEKMITECKETAMIHNKRGLIVSFMEWTSDFAYVVKAFDPEDGHVYHLERFKVYSNDFEIYDPETGKYLDSNMFLPYIDWDFCGDYLIPLKRNLYELRTPVDDRYPKPLPIDISTLNFSDIIDERLIEIINFINQFRNDEYMDLIVDRIQMYKLEVRFNRLVRMMDLNAPKKLLYQGFELVKKAYDNAVAPFTLITKL